MRDMTPSALNEHLAQANPSPLLLDVREPWEYQQVHLPNSRLIPMMQIPAALSEFDPNKEIVVICHHGVRSRQVAYFLESNGFHNVINLYGGIDAWAREVDSSLPIY